YYLGVIAESEKRFDEAEKWFAKAAAAYPGEAEALFRLGQAYFDEGKFDEAAPVLQKALFTAAHLGDLADPVLAHELLGKALEKLGRVKEVGAEVVQLRNPQ